MATNEKLETLKREIEEVRNDFQSLLIDIRVYLLEAQNPIKLAALAQQEDNREESASENMAGEGMTK